MSKRFSELPLMEQLAIEQALFSRLGEDVSTKAPDSLRAAMDEQVIGNYRAMGAKSYDMHVNSQKVGTYSVRTSKEVPEKVKTRLRVSDPTALERFIESDVDACHGTDDAPLAVHYAQAMMQNFAEYALNTFGVLPDGCEVVSETIPAQPPQVLGTTLRIDAGKVAKAIGGYLPTTVAGLLGGGEDA